MGSQQDCQGNRLCAEYRPKRDQTGRHRFIPGAKYSVIRQAPARLPTKRIVQPVAAIMISLKKVPISSVLNLFFSWSLKDSPSSNSCCRSSSDKSSYPVGYAVLCQCNIEMLQNVILEILHRPFTPDKNKGIPVIQHTHFIGRK